VTLDLLVQSYGYWAVLLGCFFEGETVLLLGGFAAQRGYLDLFWVMAAAFAGTLAGDLFYFFLGRWQHKLLLRKFPSWETRTQKARLALDRYRLPIVLSYRFLVGIRTIMAVAIGMSRIPTAQFLVLNVLGAALWALLVGGAGYLFGSAVEMILGQIRRMEILLVAGAALAALGFLGVRLLRRGLQGRL